MRSALVSTVAGLLLAGSSVSAYAQDLVFEQVGDVPLDADDIEFDQAGALWADARELYRLPKGSNTWEEVNPAAGFGGHLLVLSPDTLLLGSTNAVFRSVDGGESFELAHDEGGALFGTDVGGLNVGIVLAGESEGGTGIAYSTDRGASFTESTFTVQTNWESTLNDAVEIPDGPAAGRLVAGVFNGIVVSEDDGRSWSPSSLFQDGRFRIVRVEIGRHPVTGERRLFASGTDAQLSGNQLYASDDDGLTWSNLSTMPESVLFVVVPEFGGLQVGSGGTLLAVEEGTAIDDDSIEVWRSLDGVAWSKAGRLPPVPGVSGIFSHDMLIGPDKHLYVAVNLSGPEREWVYRSTEPVVVANEPEVPPPPVEERLVVYPNPATDRITVEASGIGEEAVLFDLLGRAVLRARLVSGRAVLDTSRLPAGVYVVRLGGESRLVTVLR